LDTTRSLLPDLEDIDRDRASREREKEEPRRQEEITSREAAEMMHRWERGRGISLQGIHGRLLLGATGSMLPRRDEILIDGSLPYLPFFFPAFQSFFTRIERRRDGTQ
jgi:hypothetical protein